MLHLRKCLVPLLVGMVLTVSCAGSHHRDNPQKVVERAVRLRSQPEPTGAPTGARTRSTLSPLKVAQEVSEVLAHMYPPTTTTSAPKSAVVVGPRVQPASGPHCEGAIQAVIVDVFGPDAGWASSIVWRESNCIPTARNGSSGSAGLFQLYHHDDLLAAVCPSVAPSVSWSDARCNTLAAKALFDGSGTAPWRL